MSTLSDLEFLILDEVYFVSSYQTILMNIGCNEESFRTAIMNLLDTGFITQMKYDPGMKDFERLEQPDLSSLNDSSFVATRQGLLIHNSRN